MFGVSRYLWALVAAAPLVAAVAFLRNKKKPKDDFLKLLSDCGICVKCIQISEKDICTIIGQKGLTLKKIMRDSNTTINIGKIKDSFDVSELVKTQTNMLSCEISGSEKGIEEAVLIITRILEGEISYAFEEIKISKMFTGHILGKCAENILDLGKEFNVKLKLEDAGVENVLLIEGKCEDVNGVKTRILKSFEEFKNERLINRISEDMYETLDANEMFTTVYVAAVQSPESFFVQIITPRDDLERFVDDMTEFYCDENNRNLFNVEKAVVGSIIAVLDDRWYRAMVDSINTENDTLECFLLDYGETLFVNIENIAVLNQRFLTTKFKAIHAGLAGIKPNDLGWTLESVKAFEDAIDFQNWKTYSCHVVGYKESKHEFRPSHIPLVKLYDYNNDHNGEDIGKKLIEAGFAIKDDTWDEILNLENITPQSNGYDDNTSR